MLANNVDPDQMPHSAASDMDLHCLHLPVSPICRVITVLSFLIALLYTLFQRLVLVWQASE